MSALVFLIKGLLLGFGIAAPVGPIGLLCIRRTLTSGVPAGLATGLGAAVADAFYGAVAAFGLTAISQFLVGQQTALRLVGGVALLWIAVRTFRAEPASRAAGAADARSLLGAFLSTAVLTVANPATIISFAAIFMGFGLGLAGEGPGTAAVLVVGVFLGSAAWWLLLSSGVSLVRGRIGPGTLRWINRGSGLLLGAFGALALKGVVWPG